MGFSEKYGLSQPLELGSKNGLQCLFCTETIPNKQHDCPVHKNSREAGTLLHHEDLELVSVEYELDEEKDEVCQCKSSFGWR